MDNKEKNSILECRKHHQLVWSLLRPISRDEQLEITRKGVELLAERMLEKDR